MTLTGITPVFHNPSGDNRTPHQWFFGPRGLECEAWLRARVHKRTGKVGCRSGLMVGVLGGRVQKQAEEREA